MSDYKTQDYEQVPYQVAELNKQIILLKAENDELKKKLKTIYDILDMCENGNCFDCKYEEYVECTSLNHNDVLQLIKQAKVKEGE